MKRPPIIVVMGHVDHGKTTLLDFIRKSNVAAKEAGSITQSTGAYEVIHNGEKITFIDTPGHEAFFKMRKRGAHIADIAILVVAATDSVQNQTKEAIKVLRESETPFVVAINKIDKASQQNIEAVKQELMKEGVLLEGYGGSISWQGISAKIGDGINELLDTLLLTAEVEGLEYDPSAPASGYVLESRLDNRRGIIVHIILKNGTLRVGDYIKVGDVTGKVKTLGNFLGENVKELTPSSPASIFGFESLPQSGEEFVCGKDEFKAQALYAKTKLDFLGTVEGVNSINLILKGDVSGSLEVLSSILRALPRSESCYLNIIEESVGDITDGDVKSAIAHKSAIVAFRSKSTKAAASLADAQNVNIIQSEIIYDLVKVLEEMLRAGTAKKVLGDLEILALFGKKGKNLITGGKVVTGEIRNNSTLEIERDKKIIGKGKIINLQSQKVDATIVPAGSECGLLLETDVLLKVSDHLVFRQ